MTIAKAISSEVGFRLTDETIEVICIKRGLTPTHEFNRSVDMRAFNLCVADTIKHALTMPNVSEGGVSISMPDRDKMVGVVNSIYSRYDEPLFQTQPAIVKPIDL